MKIYTRRGDEGRTRLFGGSEVAKHDPRVEAYGTLDELSACLGLVLARDPDDRLGTSPLTRVQEDLFTIGAWLAADRPERALARGAIPPLNPDRVKDLEEWIDRLDEELPPLESFILPGGDPVGAQIHVARTVCRRAERAISALLPERPGFSDVMLPYINRLSDLLFTLARSVNLRAGREESRWIPGRKGSGAASVDDETEAT